MPPALAGQVGATALLIMQARSRPMLLQSAGMHPLKHFL